MPRNYDTTQHNPYPRITEIRIRYSETGVPSIDYIEQLAVVDGANRVQHLASPPCWYTLDLDAVVQPVPVIHPATGLQIPGQTVTSQQLMLGILAFMRADQLRRDMVQDTAA